MDQKPNDEDLRKLHQEVNQIVQQRFLLTTVAIGVFGAMMAWAFPKGDPKPDTLVPLLTYLVCISLLFVLATLFSLHLCLKLFLRVLTTYLAETSASVWEIHWAAWRKKGKKYMGYSKPQTVVFLALGLLALLYPVFIGVAYHLRQERFWMGMTSVAGVLYLLVAILFGLYYSMEGSELVYRERWREVLSDTSKPPVSSVVHPT